MKIVCSRDMGDIDRKSIELYGIPSQILMENAGLRVWKKFRDDYPDLKTQMVVFLAGRGNNGGDACVMARQAYTEGLPNIAVVSWGTGIETDKTGQKGICRALGIPVIQWEDGSEEAAEVIATGKFIIDGLTGTGLKGRARPGLEEIIHAVNRSKAVRIAVDIPSGLGDEYRPDFPAVRAETTYTIGLPLTSLYLPAGREFCGKIRVVPICFPREETENPDIPGELSAWNDVKTLVPYPEGKAYKGSRGHLHIYAGSIGTTGAAWLAANTAVRSLPGLVTLFTDSRVYQAVAGSCRSVMVRPWDLPDKMTDSPENFAPAATSEEKYFLIGPGWGLDRPAARLKWLLDVISDEGSRGVLDADALTIFGRGDKMPDFGGRWIITPHPGEFSRLTGVSIAKILEDPVPLVLEYARTYGVVVILKCHVVYIGLPGGKYHIVDGMNPAMGTGGSGDVLAGIISGFVAAGAELQDAAVAGTCLHQEAGRVLKNNIGWFTAEDLLTVIGPVLTEKKVDCGGECNE